MRTCSIYLLLLLAGIFASCRDFLDQSPKYNLTLENAVTDYNGAKNIVNGMYSGDCKVVLLRRRTCREMGFTGRYLGLQQCELQYDL